MKMISSLNQIIITKDIFFFIFLQKLTSDRLTGFGKAQP